MENILTKVQAERGKNYGNFSDHTKAVDNIMNELRTVNAHVDNEWPEGFETALFYMVSKMVRLSTSPTHEDSALDLSSYADLWLQIIKE